MFLVPVPVATHRTSVSTLVSLETNHTEKEIVEQAAATIVQVVREHCSKNIGEARSLTEK